MGSSSSSSSSSANSTRDHRVATDNGGIGLSGIGGSAAVHITADEAFELGEVAVREAIDAASGLTRDGTDLADDVARGAFTLSERTTRDGLDFAEDLSDRGLGLSGQIVSAALDFTRQGLDLATDSNRSVSEALYAAQLAGKSEAGQLSEQLVKIGIPAIVIGVIAYGVLK